MSARLQLLKFCLTGLAAVGLTACHPAYVRESYHESYVPAYRYPSTPAYSVQYYSTVPTYVEKTVVMPGGFVARPHVTPPHAGHVERHHHNHWGSHNGDNGNSYRGNLYRDMPGPGRWEHWKKRN